MTLYESGVRDAFDKYIIEKSKQRRDYGNYWSASSAGYCMRKNIFDRLGVPAVTEDPRKYKVFEVGHIFHEFMQRITEESGLSVAQEVELIDDEIMVKGHFDDLILVNMDESGTSARMGDEIRSQHLILYDYKSVNSRSFSYKKDKMGHYHTMQLGTYMYMIRQQAKANKKFNETAIDILGHDGHLDEMINLSEARILNISKDDMRMSEQQLMWSPQLEKKVYSYWSTLNDYWKNKQMPKCTCADNDGGFMARDTYNPYFYDGEPCSLVWLKKTEKEWKGEQVYESQSQSSSN